MIYVLPNLRKKISIGHIILKECDCKQRDIYSLEQNRQMANPLVGWHLEKTLIVISNRSENATRVHYTHIRTTCIFLFYNCSYKNTLNEVAIDLCFTSATGVHVLS